MTEDSQPVTLRWRLAANESAPDALFPDETIVQRHVGTGEYRGIEFYEVNAKRVINRVPAASRMPFDHTINPYRGCSMSCAYCMAGDTPVLMGDGRTRPIADLVVGDGIYGTERVGNHRRYIRTKVLAHWSTIKPAHRVTLEDRTQLVASADHRFMTNRGWKHVLGGERGADCRPHLTTTNHLLGTGQFATGPADTDDYRTGYLCGMIRGDGTIGHYQYLTPRRLMKIHSFRLALVDIEPLVRVRQYLAELGIGLNERVFQQASGQHRAMYAIGTGRRLSVSFIEDLVARPDAMSMDWMKGFLAGIFDAEGHFGGAVRISNADPAVLSATQVCFETLGFRATLEPPVANGVRNVRLLGGLCEVLRFFHTVEPVITRKRDIAGRAIKTNAKLRVVSVEALGVEVPMYDITTGTGDFIANGVVSHNCFARPTHAYLGLGIGDDWDRKIVVKVNAVERTAAEVRSRRWTGAHIAMGTNTDPYQKAEGKYHLTRGIIEALGEARNPFSILTKSTLVLRDLDVLTAAAQRTDVRLNLSIGTLDRDVWKLTEPGTPPPDKRVEAVRRLNEAGIPCGVLVAPILPGLSDSDEQLEAIVDACVAAGAVSIGAISLHLRPGVREHFLSWLAANRPDLVALYDELFTGSKGPRSYQPKARQDELSQRVRRLVHNAEGRFGPPRAMRTARADEPRAGSGPLTRPSEQLSLL
ncbi:MAG: radical SAM protein [Acidimicrobiales bacterium]